MRGVFQVQFLGSLGSSTPPVQSDAEVRRITIDPAGAESLIGKSHGPHWVE